MSSEAEILRTGESSWNTKNLVKGTGLNSGKAGGHSHPSPTVPPVHPYPAANARGPSLLSPTHMHKNKHSRSRLALSSQAKSQRGVSGHRVVEGKAGCFKARPEAVGIASTWISLVPLWLHWLNQMQEAKTVYPGEEQILADILQAVSTSFLLCFIGPWLMGAIVHSLDIMKIVHQLLISHLLLTFD